MDDGARTSELIGLIGCAFLMMLTTLDKEGQLTKNSEIKDLGLIISLYLKYSNGLEAYGIDEEELEWRPTLVAFAKKAGIDLAVGGCDGIKDALEEEGDVYADKLKGVEKRFSWAKNVSRLYAVCITRQ